MSEEIQDTTSLPDHIRQIVNVAHDKKAFDISVLILQGSSAFTDYFIMCSATSTRQVKAVVEGIEQALQTVQHPLSHIEGYENGKWVLMDIFDLVVHVFTPDTRRFYDLERLWGNALRVKIPEPPFPAKSLFQRN